MIRATLKSLLSRKLRLILSGLAVVLGVMFVSGALVLTDTLGRSFSQITATAYEHVDAVVIGEAEPTTGLPQSEIPGSLVDRLEGLPQVREVYAEVYADGARPIDNRTDKVVSTFGPRLGGNWTGEADLYQLRDGRGPTADDEVAINAALADTGGFDVGDRIRVLTREPQREFTVVGVFGYPGDRDSLFGETHIAFTDPVAQELMVGQGDVYTEVRMLAASGTSPEELRDAVAGQVDDDSLLVQTGQEAADEAASAIEEGLAFLDYILLGFAGVAVFVGVFLVLNTFSIIVAQRLRELALLRAVGASRRQMLGSILLEAAVIGLVASVIGLALGIGIGAGGGMLFSLLADTPIAGIGVPLSAVLAGFGVGMVVTLFAALIPALRASRVPPVAAMQEAAAPSRPLTRLVGSGAVITLAAAGALAVSLTGSGGDATLWLLMGGVLLAFIGVAMLTPLFARPVTSLLGRLFSWSVPGKLGRRNTGRNPRRTAITAAALMVGVALVTGISTIFSSAATSIDQTLETSLEAELIISGTQTTALPPTFDPAVLEQSRNLAGVASVAGLWFDQVELEGEPEFVAAVDDLPALRDMVGMTTTDGSLDQLSSGDAIIDEDAAEDRGVAAGDTLSIELPRGGEGTYQVVGVYEPTSIMSGVAISAEDAAGLRAPNPANAFIQLQDGADAEEVRLQVEELLDDSPEVVVQDQSGFVEQQTEIFNVVLGIVQGLLLLAMGIAVLGVINTLVLSVIERTRELGLLRAVGLGRAATARMVTVEAVVISLFGALLGIVVGAALGAAVVSALGDEGFSHLSLPWLLMAIYLVVAGLVGVAAAVIPAVRAARLNVLNAIAYE